MLLYLILALLSGILAGTITGLTPGIHINLIASFVIASTFLTNLPPTILLIFIISMAITHTFLDFIPSIYLGAPDEDTGLSILPGHQLLMKGKGHEAVILTLQGSVIAVASLILIIPLFIFIIPIVYPFINQMMAFFLIWISLFLLFHEKESRLLATLIFILAGFLGIATLNISIEQPLLPLLTGLFGSSTIIYSIKSKTIIPQQIIEKIKIQKSDLIKPAIATTIISPICALFPGLGSSQAAIIGAEVTRNLKQEQFLALLGSVNTLIMSTSFFILYILEKSRTGAANSISQLITLEPSHLKIIILTIFAATIISTLLTIKISKIFAKNISKINYTKISIVILSLLIIIILKFSGFLGLLIFTVSTFLGLTCIELGVRRGLLMGSLLIPTILFYLPF
ncbi:MAG: tripartite tricarboxylate transporter permease [archaeon]